MTFVKAVTVELRYFLRTFTTERANLFTRQVSQTVEHRSGSLSDFFRVCRIALVALALQLACLAVPAKATPHLVFDLNSDRVYSEQQAFDRWYPASLNKIMTTYTVLKLIKEGRISKLSPVRISAYAQSKPPSKMGFPVGTVLNVDAALKIILVKSANDVTTALAESVAGSEEAFVQLMNRNAALLGMENTRYVNPHGLHDERQYSSARDLAILARAVYREFPKEAGYFSIPAIKVGGNTMQNHNKLLLRFPGTIGMKTGFVCSAGLNVVAVAKIRGKTLVAVVLGGSTGAERNVLAAQLLESASKKVFAFALPTLQSLRPKHGIRQPVDMRPEVCERKRNDRVISALEEKSSKIVRIDPVQLQALEQKYFNERNGRLRVIPVVLGNATGPDPFGLVTPSASEEETPSESGESALLALAEPSGKVMTLFESSGRSLPNPDSPPVIFTMPSGKAITIPKPRPPI